MSSMPFHLSPCKTISWELAGKPRALLCPNLLLKCYVWEQDGVVSGAPLGWVRKGADESLILIIFLFPLPEFPHMTQECPGSSSE